MRYERLFREIGQVAIDVFAWFMIVPTSLFSKQKADVARAGDCSRPPGRAGIPAETRKSKARRALIAGLVHPNPFARKIEFDKRFKTRISVQSFCEKYLSSVFQNYVVLSRPSRLDAGRIAIVTTREAELRWTRRRCETSIVDADGEVVWS
jgi:hypothetical protein